MHILCDSAIPCTRIYLTDIPSFTQKWHMYQAAHHSIVCFSKTRKQRKEMLKNYGSGSQASTCRCSVPQSCLTLCEPVDCSTSGFPVHHQLLELAQTHVHCISDAVQPSHPLLPSSLPAFNLSQHQGLSQWSGLCIRWPKYWSFSFSTSPSNEYSGLISFRTDLFDLLAIT